MTHDLFRRGRCLILLALLTIGAQAVAQQPSAQTTSDPDVPQEQLRVMLQPLTLEELRVEAQAWQGLLQGAVEDITAVELAVLKLGPDQDPEALSEEALAQRNAAQKQLVELSDKRSKIIRRFNLVLAEIVRKEGLDETDTEPADVLEMRRYIAATDGLRSRALDFSTFVTAIWHWSRDEDGGVSVLKSVLTVIAVLFLFWVLGVLAAKGINKGLAVSGRGSQILTDFIRRNLPRIALLIGVLAGLAVVGINITPLVAVIGGASFVLAFALQDTLSNFASGAMIMFYKPFDVGDYVEVSNIQGSVHSMNLVSTTISTVDNKSIVVPNNAIWGNVITNYTGVERRRVDLQFGIGYGDDMGKAEAILRSIATEHPKTLDDPEPLVKVHELGDSSVNLICRPWVNTADYWEVYWDLTRAAKERFDAEGISIPFPQRDVHMVIDAPDKLPLADGQATREERK